MAPDKKDKKRKAAAATAAADSPAKKTKKVEAKPAESTNASPKPILKKNKGNGAEKSAAKLKVNGERQGSDNDDSESEDAPQAKVETEKNLSNKKTKKADGTAAPAPKEKITKAKKPESVAEESDDEEMGDEESAASGASASEDEEEDDRTTALIKGFESSGDEDESGDEGFNPDQPVPKIPDSKKAKRKILKKQRENKQEAEEPGTVYVGRIPHGFYEHQMKAYFSQFGEISRLRLSRNRITGRSKHYAFIEFTSTSVAKIVAATMDNYLMYGHIMKCKYVPQEQLHAELWKGANRRFKRTPWNRIEKKRLDKAKTREQWSERIDREQKRRLAKAEKLKTLGYEFELPQLKSVDEVPVQQEENKAIDASETVSEEPAKAIEAPKEEDKKVADDTPKKAKKDKKKGAQSKEQETPKEQPKKETPVAAASPATKAGAKAKKAKKTKAKA
ncbi:rRNA processing protein gar2 [Aspergillus bombycis]|uniref:rRNA processing protein gar2 n=1 Tax=Aspergillus bombycis TaxID=109264 RepID=A0A1F7ZIN0_9EURO|nr:rRNA processing protein gar2 [Aspergillus bombycis]OGM39307.1 rRNA processing protein gar2 [Aspergillus bombycis]